MHILITIKNSTFKKREHSKKSLKKFVDSLNKSSKKRTDHFTCTYFRTTLCQKASRSEIINYLLLSQKVPFISFYWYSVWVLTFNLLVTLNSESKKLLIFFAENFLFSFKIAAKCLFCENRYVVIATFYDLKRRFGIREYMSRSRNLPNKRTKKNHPLLYFFVFIKIRIENIIVKFYLNYCTQASFQLFSMKWLASVLYSIREIYTNIRGGNQWNFGVSKQFCGNNRNGPRSHLVPKDLVPEKFGKIFLKIPLKSLFYK